MIIVASYLDRATWFFGTCGTDYYSPECGITAPPMTFNPRDCGYYRRYQWDY